MNASLESKAPPANAGAFGGDSPAVGADLGLGLGRDFPLRLEIMLNPRFEQGDPERFLVLSDAGRNSKVYLGRITSGDAPSDRWVAIKMQTPHPPMDQPEDSGGLLSHAVRERRWTRELGNYLSLSGIEGFTPLHFVERAPERSGRPDRPRPWPPLLFCSERRVFFQPMAADGSPLATCRDDQPLAAVGLPGYRETSETYLYNKGEVAQGKPPVFYQPIRQGEPIHPSVATFEACLEAQRKIEGMPGAAAPKLDSPESVARFAGLAASFACMACPEREPCHAGGQYLKRLEPFSFEDGNALILELNPFHYDEFCDILGKANWKEFQKQHLGAGAGAGQAFRLRDAEKLIESRRYLFEDDGSGIDALEVFKLKWTLFTQACRSVMEYHKRCGVAHLRVEPRHLMVQADSQGEFLPRLWRFRSRLISLGSMPLETKPEEGEREEILALPINSNPVYDAEIIRNSSFGVIQRGGFILKSVDPAGEGKFTIKAELQHDGIGLPWLSGKDRVRVLLRNVVGLPPNLSFMCLLDAEQPFSQRTLFVKSHPFELKAPQAEALKRIYGVKIHNAGFVLYPLFHVPCDLFSLGMLLFRTLLVNDKQGIGDVSIALERLKQEMSTLGAVECEEGQEDEFIAALLEGQGRQHLGPVFAREQIFHSQDERREGRPVAIPKTLWAEALVTGLQLVTTIEGFSFCSNHGDYDARYPAGKMEPVARRCEELLVKIDAELLGLSRRNAEIVAAIDAVAAELAK